MFSLISFLCALLTLAVSVTFACAFLKEVTLNWGKYTVVMIALFLWIDDLVGMHAAMSFVIIGYIPLFISVFVFKNPIKKITK